MWNDQLLLFGMVYLSSLSLPVETFMYHSIISVQLGPHISSLTFGPPAFDVVARQAVKKPEVQTCLIFVILLTKVKAKPKKT